MAEWSALVRPSVPIPTVMAAAALVRVALEMVIVPPVVCEFTSVKPVLASELVATNEVRFKVVPAVVMVALPPLKSLVEMIETSFETPPVVFSKKDKSIASPVPKSATMDFMEPLADAALVPITPKVSLPEPPIMVTAFAVELAAP